MTTALGVSAGVAGVLFVLVLRELLRLRDRITRLEARVNGRR